MAIGKNFTVCHGVHIFCQYVTFTAPSIPAKLLHITWLHTAIDSVLQFLFPPLPPFLCLTETRPGRAKKKKTASKGGGGVKSGKINFALPSGVLRGCEN